MQPYKIFKKVFSERNLLELYKDKIQYRTNIGMDRVSQKAFEQNLQDNIKTISRKVLDGTYHFTRYRQVLIPKGREKAPRVISIPTIRDKLALAAYHQFLREAFSDIVDEPLLHTVISDISKEIASGKYDGYVKTDITKFYSSLNHNYLLKKNQEKGSQKRGFIFSIKSNKNRNSRAKYFLWNSHPQHRRCPRRIINL